MPQRTKTGNNEHPNIKARVIPHNTEAEQALLGCVLIDEYAPITILNELGADDFYEPAHRELFDAMKALSLKDKPIDYVTLVAEAEERGVLQKVGGLSYITTLTNVVPSADNYKYYLSIVKETSLLRKLIASSERIMDNAYAYGGDGDPMQFAEREIYALAEKQDRSKLIDMNEAVAQAIVTMDEKQKDPTAQNTVPIPFTELNELLGGFHRSDLVIIAARPAQGKTSLGMNFISHAALDESRRTPTGKVDPFKCAVFSLEMSAEQLATRLLCSVAKVSMENVNAGKRTTQEIMRIMEAQKKLSRAKIFIDDSSLTTPAEILTKCRRLKREQGLDLVLIDYLQLMTSGKRVENRQQEVSDITRNIKIAAKELDVPILLLCQMSRDIEKREKDKRQPQMSDLRESGAIEQDADIIMFLHREHDPNDKTVDEDTRTKCNIVVAKHRNGRTDTVTVRWHGEYTTFTDLYEKRKESSAPSGTHFGSVPTADETGAGEPAAADEDVPPYDEAPPPERESGAENDGKSETRTGTKRADPFDDPFAPLNAAGKGDK